MLSHHLEVSPFSDNFGFLSVPGPFLRSDEELGRPREIVDIFEIEIVDFPVFYSRSRTIVTIPWGLVSPVMPFTYVSSPISRFLCSF